MKYKYQDLNAIISDGLKLINNYDFDYGNVSANYAIAKSTKVSLKTLFITARNTYRSLSQLNIPNIGNYLTYLTNTSDTSLWDEMVIKSSGSTSNSLNDIRRGMKRVLPVYDGVLKQLWSRIPNGTYRYDKDEIVSAWNYLVAVCDLIVIINCLVAVSMKVLSGQTNDNDANLDRLLRVMDKFFYSYGVSRCSNLETNTVNGLWKDGTVAKLIVVNKNFKDY